MKYAPPPMIKRGKGKLNHLIACKQSNQIANVLLEFIDEIPYAVSLKDTRTGKYIHNNALYAKRLGLKNNDNVIGLTADDLEIYKEWDFSVPFRQWQSDDLKYLKKFDYEVKATAHHHISSHIFFDHDGFIGFDKNIKLPVPSLDNRKIIAILTCSYDTTPQSSLFALFDLYQKYYTDTHAIKLLMMYLKIDGKFKKLPNTEEMQVLIALYHQSNRKQASEILNIPSNTLFLHIQNIKENNLIEHSLEKIFIQMRKTLTEHREYQYA